MPGQVKPRQVPDSDLPEIERKWSRLSSKGYLRKVNLLLTRVVDIVDAPLEMGMFTTVNDLVIMQSLFSN